MRVWFAFFVVFITSITHAQTIDDLVRKGDCASVALMLNNDSSLVFKRYRYGQTTLLNIALFEMSSDKTYAKGSDIQRNMVYLLLSYNAPVHGTGVFDGDPIDYVRDKDVDMYFYDQKIGDALLRVFES